jgi:hypothetical protein
MTDQPIIDAIKEGLLDGNDIDATDQSRAEAVLRALRANGLVVGKVKPLDWSDEGNGEFIAVSAVGWYHIGLPALTWNLTLPSGRIPSFHDLEAAKAAAQADYEARIRGAIK